MYLYLKMYFSYLLCVFIYLMHFFENHLFKVCVWWRWGWLGERGGFGSDTYRRRFEEGGAGRT
jgi:hypothetical protein